MTDAGKLSIIETDSLKFNYLKEEADYLISKFESDKSDIEILKELELCEKELKDIYKHVLGFLLEMVREDDPYGDHSDLENMFFKELGIFQN